MAGMLCCMYVSKVAAQGEKLRILSGTFQTVDRVTMMRTIPVLRSCSLARFVTQLAVLRSTRTTCILLQFLFNLTQRSRKLQHSS